MRRLLAVLAVSAGLLVQSPITALAAGPGGWDHLGQGASAGVSALNGAVYALNNDNPGTLYAGGIFTDAGGKANADFIAKWENSAWNAVSSVTLNGNVRAIAWQAGKLYVGGVFTNVNGNPDLDYLAMWNGTSWSSPCSAAHAITAEVAALQIIGNDLYIGGSFANGAGIPSGDFLVACDLNSGAAHATVPLDGDINGGINALTKDSNGTLYAGGNFLNLKGIAAADHVAAYDGTWHAMGSGPGPSFGAVTGLVRSLTASGTNVYVGTDTVDIAQIPNADHVAKWNAATQSFSAMGANSAGTNGWFPASTFVYAMETSGSLVFAAGSFQNADGQPTADAIAFFDGSAWHPLGSDGAGNGPLNSQVNALTVYGPGLCAGGNFTNAGGDALADRLGCSALQRPDTRIADQPDGPFIGNDVYSATGAGERKIISMERGRAVTLYVDVQKDGLADGAFKVHATGAATGYTVTFFKGTTNVTRQVQAGSFSTGNQAPGGHLSLTMVINVAASSASSGIFLVTSSAASGQSDAVRLTVNAT